MTDAPGGMKAYIFGDDALNKDLEYYHDGWSWNGAQERIRFERSEPKPGYPYALTVYLTHPTDIGRLPGMIAYDFNVGECRFEVNEHAKKGDYEAYRDSQR